MDTIIAPGTPAKVFQTPKRPLSQREFQSVREKAVKESPSLYKDKVLTNPTKVHGGDSEFKESYSSGIPMRSVFSRAERLGEEVKAGGTKVLKTKRDGKVDSEGEAKSRSFGFNMDLNDNIDSKTLKCEVSGEMKDTGEWDDVLGNFESPALSKFTMRMVNKELEMRKLISNFLAMLCWNLLNKAIIMFFCCTKRGAQLYEEVVESVLKYIVYKINPHLNIHSIWFKIFSWNTMSQSLHYVFLLNIVLCLWKLLFKSQSVDVSDLQLNNKQKQLLGIVETPENMEKGSQVSSLTSVGIDQLKRTDEKKISRPFLFKTLQSPSKISQTVPRVAPSVRFSTDIGVGSSAGPNGRPAMGSSILKRPDTTPTPSSALKSRQSSRPGYIPSSRYTYMMDSPTSTKKV